MAPRLTSRRRGRLPRPQLAIHLDRDVNERGLVLDKQQHLLPVWGIGPARAGRVREWLAGRLGVAAGDVVGWELCLFDRTPAGGARRRPIAARRRAARQPGVVLGGGRRDHALPSSRRAHTPSSPCSTTRRSARRARPARPVRCSSTCSSASHWRRARREPISSTQLAASTCVSADNAHAVHPNYPERHDPDHQPIVNHGPAIKLNSNQRYATSARSAAMLQQVFDEAGVPSQVFVSRNNMPCGTTIGPITATRLGIETVDVGVPQLSMHSARELCGVDDPVSLADGLRHYFARA